MRWPLYDGVKSIVIIVVTAVIMEPPHQKTHKHWCFPTTDRRHLISSHQACFPEIAPDWPLNNSMSFFSTPSHPREARGAIDENRWIFNGSESLGQVGAAGWQAARNQTSMKKKKNSRKGDKKGEGGYGAEGVGTARGFSNTELLGAQRNTGRPHSCLTAWVCGSSTGVQYSPSPLGHIN